MKKIWNYLRSMRFGVILLLLIALCSVAGSIIPQQREIAYYAENYTQFHPTILALQLDNIFESWYFIVLLALLCLNLTLCSILRGVSLLRDHRFVQRAGLLPDLKKLTPEGVEKLRAHLTEDLRCKAVPTGESTVYTKHLFGRYGTFITHLAILLTVIFDLTIAIEVGLILACALFMKRIMETTEISVIKDEIDLGDASDMAVNEEHLVIPKGCAVYEINGPYFFGIANKFDDLMANIGHEKPKVRIIRMRKVPFIDSTGIHNLQTLIEMNHEEGIHVILSGVNPKVHSQLQKARFYDLMDSDHICPHIDIALTKAREFLGTDSAE